MSESKDEEPAPIRYPPSKLGEYNVLNDIAEGTFGKVKLAEHTVTRQKVAMKYISKADVNREKNKNRVRREFEYMKALRHPHIIKLYEVVSTPTDIIFVLEYAGGELFNYIVANGKMPEPRARRFFQQIISGIEYSHRLKIVHRDLKPENVLLDDDLNVKIADFGLSSEISDGSFLSTSCGSPNYAAPEVIRGGVYAGPEIDVWSSGVILYVMLVGKLPFEDDDVQMLFTKISQGQYHMPSFLSPDARSLISSMLVVDPIRRITVPEITQHVFFTTDLPRYLSPLPLQNGPVLGTLSSLVEPVQAMGFTIIEGLGRIDEDVIDQLAESMSGVTKQDIWDGLKRDDGIPGNAIKVAYTLLKDQKMRGQSLAEYAEQERQAQLAALDPRNAKSPGALSPVGDTEPNPFEAEFNSVSEDEADDADAEHSSDIEDIISPKDTDEPTPYSVNVPPPNSSINNFAVLNSSLPDSEPPSATVSAGGVHHLAAYASSKRASASAHAHGHPLSKKERERELGASKRTKWHFGIRSSSPPMEVMLEIYRTLKALDMEWKEKRNLGGLGGVKPLKERERDGKGSGRMVNGDATGGGRKIERAEEYDGHGGVDMRLASGIYLIETRARIDNVVVLMNLQLYMVDSANYLVDFHHKRSYRASMAPGAGRYDMADDEDGEIEVPGSRSEEEDVVSPFAFMDVACKLILHLAGYGPE